MNGPNFPPAVRSAMLLVLWHHQGASSIVGQALRLRLGMGQHQDLTAEEVAEAKRLTALFDSKVAPAAQAAGLVVTAMAERAEISPEQLDALPRRLLDIACHIRSGETLFRDDEAVDLAAHAIRGALLARKQEPLTEDQIVDCITEAKCHGGAMRMSYGSGPYEVTRPTINAVEMVRAVERAHGISAVSQAPAT